MISVIPHVLNTAKARFSLFLWGKDERESSLMLQPEHQ
jgi:hypothetical protein